MKKGLLKRILITFAVPVAVLLVGLLFTYQIIQVNWISGMELQPSFGPMENPLPVPARSVPIQGAAYIASAGNPTNPIPTSQDSIDSGKQLYITSCYPCHGGGQGDGPIAEKLTRKPANLTGQNVQQMTDGEIFMVITSGVKLSNDQISMPDLRENLAVNDRWNVVNYVRSLKP